MIRRLLCRLGIHLPDGHPYADTAYWAPGHSATAWFDPCACGKRPNFRRWATEDFIIVDGEDEA